MLYFFWQTLVMTTLLLAAELVIGGLLILAMTRKYDTEDQKKLAMAIARVRGAPMRSPSTLKYGLLFLLVWIIAVVVNWMTAIFAIPASLLLLAPAARVLQTLYIPTP